MTTALVLVLGNHGSVMAAPPVPHAVTVEVGQSVESEAHLHARIYAARCDDPSVVKVELTPDHMRMRFTGLRSGRTTCHYRHPASLHIRARNPFFVTVKASDG
jgi:hypothetical protein